MTPSTGSAWVDAFFSTALAPRTDRHGSWVHTTRGPQGRLGLDDGLPETRWRSFDCTAEDARYGIWIDAQHRLILTFVDGDLSLTQAPDDRIFNAAIQAIRRRHGRRPFLSIRDKHGRLIEHYQDRRQFLIQPERPLDRP